MWKLSNAYKRHRILTPFGNHTPLPQNAIFRQITLQRRFVATQWSAENRPLSLYQRLQAPEYWEFDFLNHRSNLSKPYQDEQCLNHHFTSRISHYRNITLFWLIDLMHPNCHVTHFFNITNELAQKPLMFGGLPNPYSLLTMALIKFLTGVDWLYINADF